ncbi:MAG: endolytic transglycosylase MltG [Candidatus Kerfeldbacteria bacterium]|nr:endolytic transglycosylase MltG [Candidatus Kerfeldbacteria bacterium]
MPRRTTVFKSTISFVLPTALVVAGVWWFFSELRALKPNDSTRQMVVIAKNIGVRGVAQQLEGDGLIRNRFAFQLAVGLAGLSKNLQAGTFELAPSMSATEIARLLTKGSVKEVVLTIPEGWTAKQIGDYLERQGIGTSDDFQQVARAHDSRTVLPDDQFDFLGGRPPAATLEGYLFPDTYRVFPDASTTTVVKKMLQNFNVKVTTELKIEAQRRGYSLFDVVTLGSIVEREVRTEADRRLVADIFWRRLAAGIPLQSDATVNYVTGKNLLQPTQADTEADSPYNTYKYKGLPPGPISNPGFISITAAIRPEPNPYFYFLTDAQGTVHYAKTYEEHLANKQKYLP